jgi:type I restriction enzyme S subunit
MEYALSELFTLQMGKTPSRDNSSYWKKSENNWISIADLTNSGKYISNTKETLSDSAVAESGIKKIPANTVIMSFKLSLGKVAITEKEMYSNEAIMAFIDKGVEKISPEYLYYLLRAKDWSKGTNKAVMGATLNKATLATIKIQLHEYDNQLEIVNMLNRVSSSIDFRKQQLTKLDELIKARFVEMFGDPLNNEKNWNTSTLAEMCDGIGDGLHGTPEYDESGEYPFINGNNLIDGAIRVNALTKRVNKATYEKHYIEISQNAILLSINGTLGKIAFFNGEQVMLGKSACYCNLKVEVNRIFVYNIMKTDAFARYLEDNSTKSTIKNVGLKAIREYRLILPPLSLQKQFAAFVEEVDKSKADVQKALDQTQLLFDSLMQQYFG